MRTYGVEHFSIQTIESCDDDKANNREKYWIDFYKSYDCEYGYNNTFGGDGGNTWDLNNHKDETREKLSVALKGHRTNQEANERLRQRKLGTTLSDDVKKKISDTLKAKYLSGELIAKPVPNRPDRTGVRHTDEARRKMSLAKIGRTYDEIYGDNAEMMRERARRHWIGSCNPNYKNVDIDLIIDMVRNGETAADIAERFHICEGTVYAKLKQFGTSMSEIRKATKQNCATEVI